MVLVLPWPSSWPGRGIGPTPTMTNKQPKHDFTIPQLDGKPSWPQREAPANCDAEQLRTEANQNDTAPCVNGVSLLHHVQVAFSGEAVDSMPFASRGHVRETAGNGKNTFFLRWPCTCACMRKSLALLIARTEWTGHQPHKKHKDSALKGTSHQSFVDSLPNRCPACCSLEKPCPSFSEGR